MIKMKKIVTSLALLMALSATSMFADVSGKKLPDGKVELTFFYGNPRATEVLVAGDFTNWQANAVPMKKTDKGFTCTTVISSDIEDITYKFISDGNWTADLRAPIAIDDGFGGKNSKAVIADLIGGSDAGGAKISFSTWTLAATQGQFATGQGDDAYLDNVTTAFTSYNKFGGNFLPNSPFFIELALSENELEGQRWDGSVVGDTMLEKNGGTKTKASWALRAADYTKKSHILYAVKKNRTDTWKTDDEYVNHGVNFGNAMQNYLNGILTNPIAYFGNTSKLLNEDNNVAGHEGNPFLGHLKFGWNTPYVNFLTGFNYAKPETNKTILWTTVDGGWDAGYDHVGGFSVFSLGEKLTQIGDAKINFTFAPNKTADRHGSKYGLWTFANINVDKFTAEVQYNGYYLGDGLFYKPFEQDVIFGAKNKFGDFSLAAQMGMTFFTNLKDAYTEATTTYNKNSDNTSWANMSGYSSSVLYHSYKENADNSKSYDAFDFMKGTAGEVKATYESDVLTVSADYRYRGPEYNQLFVTDHHKTGGKDTQTAEQGKANTQRITLDATIKPVETISFNLVPYFETVWTTRSYDKYAEALASMNSDWGCNNNRVAFTNDDGKRVGLEEQIDVTLDDVIGQTSSISLYGAQEFVSDKDDKFVGYDSYNRFNRAGVRFSIGDVGNTLKSVDVNYGFNNENDYMVFNTLVGSLNFAGNARLDLALGLRTLTPEMKDDYTINHPFGFAVGISKTLKKALKKPTLYAQYVYDMDPYNQFGSGQDGLNLDHYAVGDAYGYAGDGDTCKCDAVNYYYGTAAVRMGIRWSF